MAFLVSSIFKPSATDDNESLIVVKLLDHASVVIAWSKIVQNTSGTIIQSGLDCLNFDQRNVPKRLSLREVLPE